MIQNHFGSSAPVYWGIWFVMLASMGIHAMLLFLGIASPAQAPAAEAEGAAPGLPLPMILAGAAAVNLVLAFVARRLGRPTLYPHVEGQGFRLPPFVAHIISWALAEAVAIFGLVLAFTGTAPQSWSLGFVGVAALAMLLLRPTPPANDGAMAWPD